MVNPYHQALQGYPHILSLAVKVSGVVKVHGNKSSDLYFLEIPILKAILIDKNFQTWLLIGLALT